MEFGLEEKELYFVATLFFHKKERVLSSCINYDVKMVVYYVTFLAAVRILKNIFRLVIHKVVVAKCFKMLILPQHSAISLMQKSFSTCFAKVSGFLQELWFPPPTNG